MKFEPVRKMSVVLDIEGKPRKLGTLAWSNTERRAYFEYATEFLAQPLLVSGLAPEKWRGIFSSGGLSLELCGT